MVDGRAVRYVAVFLSGLGERPSKTLAREEWSQQSKERDRYGKRVGANHGSVPQTLNPEIKTLVDNGPRWP